jgi:hypothetical protein
MQMPNLNSARLRIFPEPDLLHDQPDHVPNAVNMFSIFPLFPWYRLFKAHILCRERDTHRERQAIIGVHTEYGLGNWLLLLATTQRWLLRLP